MADIPNLAGVATDDLVEQIGGGNFKASYINWSRTMNLLRTHAPGWLPEAVKAPDGGMVHACPKGGYLSIRFVHVDGSVTPEVPQAIMDTRNAAIDLAKITSRDVTDTHRRGVCMAAALTFGLAYELWAKIPLESGYGDGSESAGPGVSATGKASPTDGVWESMNEETQEFLEKAAGWCIQLVKDGRTEEAASYIENENIKGEELAALWTRMDSKVRTPLKKALEAK